MATREMVEIIKMGSSADQNQIKHNPCNNHIFICLIGCPFSCAVYFQKERGIWKFLVSNSSHNNPPSSNPSSHVVKRQLSNKNQQEVQQVADSGLKPSQTLQNLKNNYFSVRALN
ncbi:uncharacterized protein VP01_4897g1 [Puccinia sorghi]|uniref:Uncharacterized protein n=1 Tax=Puccinia sorghi TaxID=27349 RepID=A0A0L6UM72_9BASI|nr:uncharacterized protein VP01_4897g1 [Puccinia sorghi]